MNQPSTTPGSLEYFRLRPLKAVKVSDISETTANAPVPAEKKVNFHIGHPVYDSRLLDIYASLVSGLPKNVRHQNGDALRGSLENTLWEETDESTLRLLYEAMEQSVQYIPRGGYSGKKPNRLAELVRGWLEDHQREGLDYGLGGESEPREIVFSAGGQQENMRVLFHALSRTLIQTPAYIFAHGNTIPKHLTSFDNLVFPQTPADELKLLDTLSAHFNSLPESPHFLVLFRIHSESVRRELRRMSLDYPLFFIEMNDALNHHSLAREAGMLNQVLRFISPSAIHSSITADSLNIVAGYAEFVKLFETIHFQLKGTPSGAEIVLLTTQIERAFSGDSGGPESEENSQKQVADPSSITEFEYTAEVAERFGSRIQDIVESRAAKAESLVERLADTSDRLGRSVLPEDAGISDPLMGMDRHEIVEKYVHGNPGFSAGEITESLLSQFLRHHPEYESESAAVVSGSARTALSLLGFHCGIREAVVPDLSWTYEHCFPSVEAVSLGENLTLDARAIIDHIRGKLEADPEWREYGAFVLNNPHNASGRVFESSEVKLLLRWLLSHDITVIDDLAYENLGPMESLNGPPTMRALAKDLKRSGHIRASQLRNLITVHSLSKTDCFAGARLAVAHIPDKEILARFSTMNAGIVPNTFAVLIASLFYRNHEEDIRQFWQMRNTILHDRLQALLDAHEALPEERNPFGIRIRAPQGAMYPHLTIDELPAGISLDWLGIGLATRGIGLVPLTTFARTSEGFDLARKSFRLTLGGADPAEELRHKARRVLIDLNRLISEEAANYSREPLPPPVRKSPGSNHFDHAANRWNELSARLATLSKEKIAGELRKFSREIDTERYAAIFSRSHLPERLETLTTQFKDRMEMAQSLVSQTTSRNKESVLKQLERELIPTSLDSKEENFRNRMFDRTVHPTQMNSLKVDILANKLFQSLLNGERIPEHRPDEISDELIEEYLGTNVPLLSREEMSELVNDLRMMVGTEEYARLRYNLDMPLLLSFWGDWDGSTRPSGQGHRLAAAALLENVSQLSGILQSLSERDKTIEISTELLDDIRRLDASKREFWDLLNEITSLTNQLEKRYQQVLPFGVQPGKLRKLGMRLRLARDPVRALWQHNDRLERKMRKLRDQRRENLEYYFALNQRLRKTLRKNLDVLEQHLEDPAVALKAGTYRDILKRFVLTPRIHQKMILAQDQFAIDATVHNITEINEIAGKYGHPGLVMALQISMSDEPEAFISLERKLRSRRDEVLRDNPGLDLPRIKVVPLFEDVDTVHNLESYLDSVWDYAGHSRKLDQSQIQRFSEMVCELFVAGSDLSQQMSQLAGAELYKEAKHRAMRWLTNHGLVGNIRMKLGSGEPMQRQGGYFDGNAGLPSTEIS
ncbi:MAG: pyridoxal phosphate-dependent aminotransferase, partial [Candidatus Marinimicrobia bacterium]|nr:pyridoxal phosphate-dependent aminotransferase [Candidatus Neomarinimicrobiota bacterium]